MQWDSDQKYMWADAGTFSARAEDTGGSPRVDRFFWVVCAEGRTLETGTAENMLDAVAACEFVVDVHRALWNMPITPDPRQKAIEQ